ncbi:MAG: hypothetical protein KF798_06470 [Candidatus Paracaedibacteraceae bacterium]|nr:hypothetical protein [Candidatus Paracaedibacteraceae bacterium]
MNKEQYDHIIASLWVILAREEVLASVDCLAECADVDVARLREIFPTPEKIILALIEDVWTRLSLPDKTEKLTSRDQIFDAVMMAFDLVAPYRSGLKKMTQDRLLSPSTYLDIAPRLTRFGSDIVKHYYDDDGIFAIGVTLAFNAAFATTFWTFLEDDTFDLSKTMASLDASLKTVSSVLSYCPGSVKFE